MRLFLAILLFIPVLCFAGNIDTVTTWRGQSYVHVIAEHLSPLVVRYREETTIDGALMAPIPMRYWTNYTWSTANGNILLNTANYPSITGGDSLMINAKSGGYRSSSIAGVNSGAPNSWIVEKWNTGAFITPDVSLKQANSLTNIYGVKVVGMTMNDNIDNAFTTYAAGGFYSQYVWFDSCTFRGMNGFFPSSAPTLTTPNFTGDTINCFYKWRWSRCIFDSLVGSNSGNSAIRIGDIKLNQFWINVEIDHCFFGDYSSAPPGGPANYISATNVFGLYIHDDSCWDLGMHVASPQGHAAQFYIRTSYFEIYNCYFGPDNFGNCIRDQGTADIPSMAATFAQWSVGYDGRSRVYNCITAYSRKYPLMEEGVNTGDTATLSPWVRLRTCPQAWYITGVKFGMGVCCQAYVTSLIDCYETDSLFLKNSYIVGELSDTVWNTVNAGPPLFQGTNKLITTGAGPVTVWDTAGTNFIQKVSQIGLSDSLIFIPASKGMLYNSGIDPPAWITDDYFHRKRVTQAQRRTKGAVLANDDGIIVIPVGSRIKYN